MKFNKLHISFCLVLTALLSAIGISQPQTSAYVYQDLAKNTSSFKQSDITKAFVFEEPGSYDVQSNQEDPAFSPVFFSNYLQLDVRTIPQQTLQISWNFIQDHKSKLETQIFPFHFFS